MNDECLEVFVDDDDEWNTDIGDAVLYGDNGVGGESVFAVLL